MAHYNFYPFLCDVLWDFNIQAQPAYSHTGTFDLFNECTARKRCSLIFVKISRNQYRREKALHLIPFKTSQDLFARFRGVLSLIPLSRLLECDSYYGLDIRFKPLTWLLYILQSRFPSVTNKRMLTRLATFLTGGDWCARRDLNSENLHPKCSASAKLRHGHIILGGYFSYIF